MMKIESETNHVRVNITEASAVIPAGGPGGFCFHFFIQLAGRASASAFFIAEGTLKDDICNTKYYTRPG